MTDDARRWGEDWDVQAMSRVPSEKTWLVPARAHRGPMTISLRVPEVCVTDSDGRQITIAPEQAELLAAKLSRITDWLQHGQAELVDADE